jgi:hypothetical protein
VGVRRKQIENRDIGLVPCQWNFSSMRFFFLQGLPVSIIVAESDSFHSCNVGVAEGQHPYLSNPAVRPPPTEFLAERAMEEVTREMLLTGGWLKQAPLRCPHPRHLRSRTMVKDQICKNMPYPILSDSSKPPPQYISKWP